MILCYTSVLFFFFLCKEISLLHLLYQMINERDKVRKFLRLHTDICSSKAKNNFLKDEFECVVATATVTHISILLKEENDFIEPHIHTK